MSEIAPSPLAARKTGSMPQWHEVPLLERIVPELWPEILLGLPERARRTVLFGVRGGPACGVHRRHEPDEHGRFSSALSQD